MIEIPESIRELLLDGRKIYFPNVAVDNVIFGYHQKELKVLLQRPQSMMKWVLPGGYIKRTESAETAASRIAEQRTGLKGLNPQQFRVFSDPFRNQGVEVTAQLMSNLSGLKIKEDHWMLESFITIGFYTLTDFTLVEPNGSFYMEECRWWDINAIPSLMFDHNEIVECALSSLRLRLEYYPVGFELLPEKFTLPEIRTLYETILGKELDDRNFSKKLISLGIIEKLSETRKISGHRPPFLYRFNKERYMMALKSKT